MAVTGRHDPCIVPRAVPCVEAAAAIAVCDALKMGVTLVPTVVRGVNDDQLGALIRFAAENVPAVRGGTPPAGLLFSGASRSAQTLPHASRSTS